MILNVLQIICFCLINYVLTFPIDLFDELWETNQSEPQPNNNTIESQPKIKVEPHEAQFDGRWQDETALKGIVKVEHGPHYGAVNVERTDKIKHELEWRGDESGEFKKQLEDYVKEEDQDGQAPNTSDQKKIGDNSNKQHLSDQNNSTDQDESVDEQQNDSNKCEKIESDRHKLEIIQKFREMKDGKEKKSKFSDLEKREILNQFDQIKSKCKQANLKNITMRELDEKIAIKLGVCRKTIFKWKGEFGLSVSNKRFSNATKIGILKKYAKIQKKNPKMSDCAIADLLKISSSNLCKWKAKFRHL